MEVKDRDNERIADLLGKVDALTKVLKDKFHQLTNSNCVQFGTNATAKTIRRVDDYGETQGFVPEDIREG